MNSQVRQDRIHEKYEQDQSHIQYLLLKGWLPLEIADHMIQYLIDLLRESEKKKHPDWTDSQILEEMRMRMLYNSQLQKKRGLRQTGRI